MLSIATSVALGQSCSGDWTELNGKCSQRFGEAEADRISWQAAEDNCVALGGHLASAASAAEVQALAAFCYSGVSTSYQVDCAVGLYRTEDTARETKVNNWVWTDGSPWTAEMDAEDQVECCTHINHLHHKNKMHIEGHYGTYGMLEGDYNDGAGPFMYVCQQLAEDAGTAASQEAAVETSFAAVSSGTCEEAGFLTITDNEQCGSAAAALSYEITWPSTWATGGACCYDDVVDGCSVRAENMLFFGPIGTNTNGQTCTTGQPCLCATVAAFHLGDSSTASPPRWSDSGGNRANQGRFDATWSRGVCWRVKRECEGCLVNPSASPDLEPHPCNGRFFLYPACAPGCLQDTPHVQLLPNKVYKISPPTGRAGKCKNAAVLATSTEGYPKCIEECLYSYADCVAVQYKPSDKTNCELMTTPSTGNHVRACDASDDNVAWVHLKLARTGACTTSYPGYVISTSTYPACINECYNHQECHFVSLFESIHNNDWCRLVTDCSWSDSNSAYRTRAIDAATRTVVPSGKTEGACYRGKFPFSANGGGWDDAVEVPCDAGPKTVDFEDFPACRPDCLDASERTIAGTIYRVGGAGGACFRAIEPCHQCLSSHWGGPHYYVDFYEKVSGEGPFQFFEMLPCNGVAHPYPACHPYCMKPSPISGNWYQVSQKPGQVYKVSSLCYFARDASGDCLLGDCLADLPAIAAPGQLDPVPCSQVTAYPPALGCDDALNGWCAENFMSGSVARLDTAETSMYTELPGGSASVPGEAIGRCEGDVVSTSHYPACLRECAEEQACNGVTWVAFGGGEHGSRCDLVSSDCTQADQDANWRHIGPFKKVGWCGALRIVGGIPQVASDDSSDRIAQSTFPSCIDECVADENCFAIRWANGGGCDLMKQCRRIYTPWGMDGHSWRTVERSQLPTGVPGYCGDALLQLDQAAPPYPACLTACRLNADCKAVLWQAVGADNPGECHLMRECPYVNDDPRWRHMSLPKTPLNSARVPKAWRCYTPSTLDATYTQYKLTGTLNTHVGGPGAEAALPAALASCTAKRNFAPNCAAPKRRWKFPRTGAQLYEEQGLPTGVWYGATTTMAQCFAGCGSLLTCKQAVWMRATQGEYGICYPSTALSEYDENGTPARSDGYVSIACNQYTLPTSNCAAPSHGWRFTAPAEDCLWAADGLGQAVWCGNEVTMEACFSACGALPECKQAVWYATQGANGNCYPTSSANSADADGMGGSNEGFVSTTCNPARHWRHRSLP